MSNKGFPQQWSFFGRVLPERVGLTFNLPGLTGNVPDLNVSFKMVAHIHSSQIVARIELLHGEPDIYTLRNLVEGVVRSNLDLIGFLQGISLDVEIVSCASLDGDWQIFGAEVPFLYDYSANVHSEIDQAFLKKVLSDSTVEIMLSDYREAMRVPLQTGFFCYRSVEACMQSFRDNGTKSKEAGWEALRTSLNVDRTAINIIKEHADWARHGEVGFIISDQRKTVLSIINEIIRRYLEFVFHDRQPLALSDYPLLNSAPVAEQAAPLVAHS
ncbi:MAG: hypothetical protein KF810_17465 [Rhizobiaceae bacterium]|nr:hypothetical protein [Rhizobiaceae bacterium]